MNSPYKKRPRETFWKTGVQIPGPVAPPNLYKRKWPISRDEKIATAGSCFAQHIGRNLRAHGFSVMDVEPPPARLPEAVHADFGFGLFSARYGNIYTARQLLQLAQEAFGIIPTPDIAWCDDKGRWFDALRPGVEPEGLHSREEVFAHRRSHLEAVRRMFETMDLLVFTLGLTEAWVDRRDGTVFATAPGTVAGSYDPDVHVFHNFTFAEIHADLVAVLALLDAHRSRPLRKLLTVSPVPLAATATDKHVMVATVYSKAILRAVAGQLASEREDIDYFPSFEIISNPWSGEPFYEADLRGVAAHGVARVMKVFLAAHVGEAAPAKSPQAPAAPIALTSADDDVKCEEALLAAFAESGD